MGNDPNPYEPKKVPTGIKLTTEQQEIAKSLVAKSEVSMQLTKQIIADAISKHRQVVKEMEASTRAMWDQIFKEHPHLAAKGENMIIDRETWEIIEEQHPTGKDGCGDSTCQHCGGGKHEAYEDGEELTSMEIPEVTQADPTVLKGEKNSAPVTDHELSTDPEGKDLYIPPQAPTKPSTEMPEPPKVADLNKESARSMVKDFLSQIGHSPAKENKEEPPPQTGPAKDS